jgi:hypothetical protein
VLQGRDIRILDVSVMIHLDELMTNSSFTVNSWKSRALWLKERNPRCYEDFESSIEDILASFFHTLYLWTMTFLFPLSISFANFLVRFSIPS